MKYCIVLLLMVLLISCNQEKEPEPIVNGIMIDCARLLERKEYYFHLIDFMADWDMNTLLLHFSDDHGLSIQIPGFEELARARAFTVDEIKELIKHAESRGIEIIPELEVFGHTRYITDHPKYQHLALGQNSKQIAFNAINPLEPEAFTIISAMIAEVATLFPSQYLHLGCDEVNLEPLSTEQGLDEATVWTEYVNRLICYTRQQGKTPMIWNDHVRKNEDIARRLAKNVILMEWNYHPDYQPEKMDDLSEMGYEHIIMAPSIACYRLRVLPTIEGLQNTDAMAKSARDGTAGGMINTIWLPMRYLQDAMWYGIAYSAFLINSGEEMDLRAFHETFALKVFDQPLTDEFHTYLEKWPLLHIDYPFYHAIARGDFDFSNDLYDLESVKAVNHLTRELLYNPPGYAPRQNMEIHESMQLAAKVVYVISEGLLILSDESSQIEREKRWRKELRVVIDAVDRAWDRGRYPDDPQKYEARFSNLEHSYLLIVLKKLESCSL